MKPDIVHTRNWGGLDGIIAGRLAGIRNIDHGEHGWSMDDPAGLNPKRVFIRKIINVFVKKYTCVSRQMKTWLERDIKVGKEVTQVYNGIDCAAFCPGKDSALRSELGIQPEIVVMGVVARLDPIKNHIALIKVFNKVHAENTHTCLLIIGEGSERQRLEEMSGSGIIFLGNRLDVHALLNGMDIFILPSFNEGISNTILEAMATGLAVIASDRGGNPELVKHNINGMVFEPEDLSGLEKLIINYIHNPGLRQMHGTNGRKDAENIFSIQHMVNGYENVWKSCFR